MNKDQRNDYQRSYNIPKRLQKKVNSLEDLSYLYCKSLRKDVNEAPISLRNFVNSLVTSLRKCVNLLESCLRKDVNGLQKNVNGLQKNVNENGEICEKTAILAVSAKNSHVFGEGGVGGVGALNNLASHTTVADNNNSESNICSLTDVDVKRKDFLKEKNTKKRKKSLQKNVKPYSEDFETFHKIYPNKDGKAKAFEHWEKYRADGLLPELGYILACVEIFKKSEGWLKDDGLYIPQCKTFVYNRRWEDIPKDKVEAYLNNKNPGKPKPPELPTLEEWNKWGFEKQFSFASRLKVNRSDIERIIERRASDA